MQDKIVPSGNNSDNPLQFVFQGHEIRIIADENGEPLFIASDICVVLNIDVGRALARLDDDEKGMRLAHTPGGMQNVSIVTEPGLYNLVGGSRKPETKIFKRWIYHEVLPSIRKTGSYISPNLDPLEIAKQMIVAIENQRRQIAAIEREQQGIKAYEQDTRQRVVRLERRTPQQQYFSILEYCRFRNLDTPNPAREYAAEIRAERLSIERGFEIMKAPDAERGEINTYHRDILRVTIGW